MNKHGNILDFVYVPVLLFIIVMTLIVSLKIVNVTKDTGIFDGYPDSEKVINQAAFTLVNMDNMMLFMLVGISLFVMISGFFSNNHPAFFIISLLLLMVAVIIGAALSNTFWKFSVIDSMASTVSEFPKTTFIMERIPYYLAFLGMTTIALMYVNFRRTQ